MRLSPLFVIAWFWAVLEELPLHVSAEAAECEDENTGSVTDSTAWWVTDTSNYKSPPKRYSSVLEIGDQIPMARNVKFYRDGQGIYHNLGIVHWYLVFPSKNPDSVHKFDASARDRLGKHLGAQQLHVVTDPADDGFRALFFNSEDKFDGEAEKDDTKHLFVSVGRNLRIVDKVSFHTLDDIWDLIPTKEPNPYKLKEKPWRPPPPILVIPDAINPGLAQELVDYFDHELFEDNSTQVRIDNHGVKRRHTIFLNPQDKFTIRLDNKLSKTVFPEIEKVFYARIGGREDWRIGRYSGEMGGHVLSHRDTTTYPYRRFAMSLILNDDYEGGGLFFPEYSEDVIDLPRYSCAVFPGTVMHGVKPIHNGTRVTLLSFLFPVTDLRPETLKKSYQVMVGRDVRGFHLEDLGLGEGGWDYRESF
jgi:hypothetical protein